jgi:hypothetical protein
LEKSGEIDVDGQLYDCYQCEDCTLPWEFDGETFETALTFAVDASGRCCNPETLEPLNLN